MSRPEDGGATVPLGFLPVNSSLARALAEREYLEPTPVQTAVMEAEAAGRDLLVSAETGSGKTVAYGMAIAATLLESAEFFGQAGLPLALIVVPTRELALQVQRELTWLYQHARARIASCVGGMDPRQERHQLSAGVHIVVGTPGRLRDHLERGALNVSGLKALVLDEADEMLDLGFREDLEFILKTTPPERRTLMFSATLPKAIVTLARRYQRDALRIQTSGEQRGHADIEYRALRIAGQDVEHAVVNVLRFIEPPSALIFCNTREAVRHLQATLSERGFSAVLLSGELSQHERNHALQALRDGRARVCVATDVAARGIDLPQLGLVIHADLPNDAEVLQHRSGRTGRAGRKGISVLLVPPHSRHRAAHLLANARIEAAWGEAPTLDSIRQLDQERFLNSTILTEAASEDDLNAARDLLAKRSAADLVAALVRLYRSQLPAAEELSDPGGANNKPVPRFPARGAREQSRDRGEERRESHGRAPMKSIWFRLDIGRQKNADPKWLVPLICRKGKVTKQDIGRIAIFDEETKFEIEESVAERFALSVASAPSGNGHIERASESGSGDGKRVRAPLPSKPEETDAGKSWGKSKHESPPEHAPTREAKRAHRGKSPHSAREAEPAAGPYAGQSPTHSQARAPEQPASGKPHWKSKHAAPPAHAGKAEDRPDHAAKPKFTGKKKFGAKQKFAGKAKFDGAKYGSKYKGKAPSGKTQQA